MSALTDPNSVDLTRNPSKQGDVRDEKRFRDLVGDVRPRRRRRRVVAFDPDQPRDGDGKWTDGPGVNLPDLNPADDKLGLAERIRLNRGERLVGSSRVRAGDMANYQNAAVLARIATGDGPQLRLGIVDAGHERDDTRRWSASNRGGTVNLDGDGIRDLRDGLNDAISRGRQHQKVWRAFYRDEDNPDKDPGYDPDEVLHTGSVSSPWGDLVYRLSGVDDEDGGWSVSLAVRPPDAGDGWEPPEERELDLAPAQLRRLVKELDAALELPKVEASGLSVVSLNRRQPRNHDVTAHRPGKHDQSSHGRRYGPGGNPLRRLTRGGKRNAVRALNRVLRDLRGDEAANRPGMSGGALTNVVRGVRDGVDSGQFTPDQAVTLLSSLVFRPDVASNPHLSGRLSQALDELRGTPNRPQPDTPDVPDAPGVPAVTPGRAPAPPRPNQPGGSDPADLVGRLRSASSRDEARDLLAGLTVAQLKTVAGDAGITIPAGGRKTDVLNRIVQQMVGRRLDFDAITRRPVRRVGAMVQVQAAADVRTGAMVAVLPSQEDAQRLAVNGGEAAGQLHATVLFLGDADQYPPAARQAIVDAVRELAEVIPAGEADGMAISAFNPDKPDKDTCIVLELGGEGLEDVHGLLEQAVTDAAAEHGLILPEQHSPYRPHITLLYTDDLMQVPALADRAGPVRLDRIRVAFAGENVDIPLPGEGSGMDEDDMPAPDEVRAQAGSDAALRRYWLTGKGAAKIRWRTPGDFTRCVRQLRKHVRDPKGLCAEYHFAANGFWPGDRRNLRASAAEEEMTLPNPTPTIIHAAAQVSVDDVRTAFYRQAPQRQWIREFRTRPQELIVADDGSGGVARVAYEIDDDGSIRFSAPKRVRVEYVEDDQPEQVAASRMVYASAAESRPSLALDDDPDDDDEDDEADLDGDGEAPEGDEPGEATDGDEEDEEDPEEVTAADVVAHMPGKHDQSSHGRKKGARVPSVGGGGGSRRSSGSRTSRTTRSRSTSSRSTGTGTDTGTSGGSGRSSGRSSRSTSGRSTSGRSSDVTRMSTRVRKARNRDEWLRSYADDMDRVLEHFRDHKEWNLPMGPGEVFARHRNEARQGTAVPARLLGSVEGIAEQMDDIGHPEVGSVLTRLGRRLRNRGNEEILREPRRVRATTDPQPQTPAAEPGNPSTKEEEMPLNAEVLERLGLDVDADPDEVNAAVLEVLDRADEAPDPKQVQAAAAERDELTKEVGVLRGQVEAMSAKLAEAEAQKAAEVKASVLDKAQAEGKFKPAEREQWDKDYDEAPAAVTRILASIAVGTAVPVNPLGKVGDPLDVTANADEDEPDWLFSKMPAAVGGES